MFSDLAFVCAHSPWGPNMLRISGLGAGAPEPVRHSSVELCCLAGSEHENVVAED